MRSKRIMAAALLAATCMMFAACGTSSGEQKVNREQWDEALEYFVQGGVSFTVTQTYFSKLTMRQEGGEPYGYERTIENRYEVNGDLGHSSSKGTVAYIGDGEAIFGGGMLSVPDEERYYDGRSNPAIWYTKDEDGTWWKESSGGGFFSGEILGMASDDFDDYEYDPEQKAYVGQFPFDDGSTDDLTMNCLIRFDRNGRLKEGEASVVFASDDERTDESKVTWSIAYSAAEIVLPALAKDPPEGLYQFDSYFLDGVTYKVGDTLSGEKLTEDFYKIELKRGGRCTFTMMGITFDGTWETDVPSGTITVKITDSSTVFEWDGDTLTYEEEGTRIVLKK